MTVNADNGFTLIELMMVIALMGILAGIATPLFSAYRQRAQIAACVAGMKVIEQAVISYSIENGEYPDSLETVGLDGLKDPWGKPYQYLKIAGTVKGGLGLARKDHFMVPINTDFDLYSMGPDGQSKPPLTTKASQDDIIRANDGQYFGSAASY